MEKAEEQYLAWPAGSQQDIPILDLTVYSVHGQQYVPASIELHGSNIYAARYLSKEKTNRPSNMHQIITATTVEPSWAVEDLVPPQHSPGSPLHQSAGLNSFCFGLPLSYLFRIPVLWVGHPAPSSSMSIKAVALTYTWKTKH